MIYYDGENVCGVLVLAGYESSLENFSMSGYMGTISTVEGAEGGLFSICMRRARSSSISPNTIKFMFWPSRWSSKKSPTWNLNICLYSVCNKTTLQLNLVYASLRERLYVCHTFSHILYENKNTEDTRMMTSDATSLWDYFKSLIAPLNDTRCTTKRQIFKGQLRAFRSLWSVMLL